MPILTEPIGSIPRPPSLIETIAAFEAGMASDAEVSSAYSDALRDTIARLEETGSPIITDGEQTKPSFRACLVSNCDLHSCAGLFDTCDAARVYLPWSEGASGLKERQV